jgi:hypothetical protein
MFIFALDKCSNQYPLVGGVDSAWSKKLKARKMLDFEACRPLKALLARV